MHQLEGEGRICVLTPWGLFASSGVQGMLVRQGTTDLQQRSCIQSSTTRSANQGAAPFEKLDLKAQGEADGDDGINRPATTLGSELRLGLLTLGGWSQVLFLNCNVEEPHTQTDMSILHWFPATSLREMNIHWLCCFIFNFICHPTIVDKSPNFPLT